MKIYAIRMQDGKQRRWMVWCVVGNYTFFYVATRAAFSLQYCINYMEETLGCKFSSITRYKHSCSIKDKDSALSSTTQGYSRTVLVDVRNMRATFQETFTQEIENEQ